jgi:exonuclease SbcD
MKILHTSDWHLGQKFLHNDREMEHRLALDWLLDVIREEAIDLLLVAGDIFDIGNPPNYARRLYYHFLTRLLETPCRHVLITGGNHDSPSMLSAPRELLEVLNIRVVAAATGDPADEIIEFRNDEEELELVIAAVPFLRDADLKYSVAGETGFDRIAKIKEGIQMHYAAVAELMEKYVGMNIPLLATGHLYASGAETSAEQNNIYIGDLENIEAGQFPAIFDYVALGHIHRAQLVGGLGHIRYSGSLIPLSFSETKDEKQILLLEFEDKRIKDIKSLHLPIFRRLKTIQGDLDTVKQRLRDFDGKGERQLTPWVEVIVDTEEILPQLDVELRTFTEEMQLEILKIKLNRQYQGLAEQSEQPDLEMMDQVDVFQLKCESYGSKPEELEELTQTFRELMEWMQESELDIGG